MVLSKFSKKVLCTSSEVEMRTQKRTGFTLVELMVAMALTLFVMVILTQAFVTALETFAAMKGIGDIQQNLRTAVVVLRNDLIQDHFEGKRRLSDLDGNNQPLVVPNANNPAPRLQNGFFAVRQGSAVGSANYVLEGYDANNLPSFRANDQMLYMTVKRKGNRQSDFFTAFMQDTSVGAATPSPYLNAFFGIGNPNPPKTAYGINPTPELAINTLVPSYPPPPVQPQNQAVYASQWAEVFYYLVRTGSTEEPNNPTSMLGTPTFALYRAQFVMTPDGTGVSTLFANASGAHSSVFAGMSCNPNTVTGKVQFYSPADAPTGGRVVPNMGTFVPPPAPDTLSATADFRFANHTNHVLSNVISFHIQVMPTGGFSFVDVSAVAANGIYDTAGVSGAPTVGLKAIQITLRVWDPNSRQSRQMTIVQDL
jgi:prepilin-type N-terminal cleavage/methylation domain-containing protein